MNTVQIIKGLEIHAAEGGECDCCPYLSKSDPHSELCITKLIEDALALVKEQEAKIEKLTEERDTFIKCAYMRQHLLESINEKLEHGYERSAARACAEMEMWHMISLQEKKLQAQIENLKKENKYLRERLAEEAELKEDMKGE